jgi:DNA repair exonuclease SbcCD ATPase subunit
MPKHDNEPLTDIPKMVPDRDELVSYQRQKQGKPRAKERDEVASEDSGARPSNALTYVIGVVAVLAVAAAGYLFTQLQSAQERVAALEQRLSSTDESVNQSSGALQIKINEVNEALELLRSDTLKKYKAQIDQQVAQIAALDKAGKNAQTAIAANDKTLAEQNKSIDALRGDITKLPTLIDPVKQKIDQHQASLDALSNKVKAVNDAQTKLDTRLSNNEEWVESINTFRKQMNREIVNIKQQVAGGKPTPPPADIQ